MPKANITREDRNLDAAEEWPKIIAIRIDDGEEAQAMLELVGPAPFNQTPRQRVALRIIAATLATPGECMVCGCTDEDCSGCIARTGMPCSWANTAETLCSACVASIA